MQRTFLYSDTSEILRLRHCYASVSNNCKNESIFLKSTIENLLSELERTRKHCYELAGLNRKLNTEEGLLMGENKMLRELNRKLNTENGHLTGENKMLRETLDQLQQSQMEQSHPKTTKKRKSQFTFVDESENDAVSPPGGDAVSLRRSTSMPPPETPLGTTLAQNNSRDGSTVVPRQIMTMHASGGIKRRRAMIPALMRNSRISQSHGDLTGRNFEDVDDALPSVCESPWLFADQLVHIFQKKRNLLKQPCASCERAIGFSVIYVKCTRCKEVFHESCRHCAPLPCVRRQNTPKTVGNVNKFGRPRLGDFCPDNRPMVPPLVIFCTYFLDHCKTYVPYKELYQIEGNHSEMEAVMKQFVNPGSKGYPQLDPFPPVIISACVNKFLTQIREPLIPYSYGKEICALLDSCSSTNNESMDNNNLLEERLASIVEDLPVAHMDTLGHLCRHWNRIASNSFGMLSIDALSVSLGPLVFGSARLDCPPLLGLKCVTAMAHLLCLGTDDFWTNASLRTQCTGTPVSRNPSQRSARSVLLDGTPQLSRGTSPGAIAAGERKGGGHVATHCQQQQQRAVDLNATSGDTSSYESAHNSQQR